MKIYFPDDPIKQEMLEGLVFVYEHTNPICDNNTETCVLCKIQPIIERAAGESIKEIIKN